MLEMVEARRKSDKTEQRHDLFTGLLDAAAVEEPDNGVASSDQELLGKYPSSHCLAYSECVLISIVGNMFVFLFAGHEVGQSPSSLSMA
jgi:hypothetical protein